MLEDVVFDFEKGFLLGETRIPLYGLIQCKILPPESLFLPVLPVLADNKLFYPLCSACLLHRRPQFCRHSAEKRALTDVWTLVEVAEAVRMGYSLLDTYEMLVYCEGEPIFQRCGQIALLLLQILRVVFFLLFLLQILHPPGSHQAVQRRISSVGLDPRRQGCLCG